MSKGYEKNVYMAMLAEQCNRFEEMTKFLEDMLTGRDKDLNSDERNLLSIAYKNSLTSRRTALRTVIAYETKEKKKDSSPFLSYIQEYRKKIEDELTKMCNNVLNILDSYDAASKDASNLSPIHPISLGLALNFSVFHYEVMGDHDKACSIARDILDVANEEMKKIEVPDENENHRDAMSIINLLRENLDMWKMEADDS